MSSFCELIQIVDLLKVSLDELLLDRPALPSQRESCAQSTCGRSAITSFDGTGIIIGNPKFDTNGNRPKRKTAMLRTAVLFFGGLAGGLIGWLLNNVLAGLGFGLCVGTLAGFLIGYTAQRR